MTMRDSRVLSIVAVIAPITGVLEPLGLAPLLVVAAVAALALRIMTERDRPWRPMPLIGLLAAFAAWSLASALWSINPGATLHKFPLLAGAFLCGAVLIDSACALTPHDRARITRLLGIGFAIAIAILIVELAANFPYRHLTNPSLPDRHMYFVSYNRGATVMALLVWPVAAMLWRKQPRYAMLLVAATLAVLCFYISGAARAAVIIGAIAAAFALAWPKATAAVLTTGMIVYIVTSPLIHTQLIDADTLHLKNQAGHINSTLVPPSGYHRLLIWNFASKKIEQRPVLGWGLESSRFIPGGKALLGTFDPALPLHPHNGILQIWLELGVPGMLMLVGLVGWMMTTIRNAPWPPIDKAASLALVAGVFVIINLSYGIWQGWWVAALFFAATFCVGAMPLAAAQRREAGVPYQPATVKR